MIRQENLSSMKYEQGEPEVILKPGLFQNEKPSICLKVKHFINKNNQKEN